MQTSTPQDLGKIRHELLARRASLRYRHERIQRDLQRRNDPLVADAPDRAIQLQNDATLQVIDDATNEQLATIQESLQRLERGLYGICKVCGGDIEDARVHLLHAVTCSDCARD
jgi:RNA polymerase-binding transcription factor DksA